MIVNKNVYYKNSILFIEKIRDLITIKKVQTVKINLNIVLKSVIFV